jgi:outer membrane protein TolC
MQAATNNIDTYMSDLSMVVGHGSGADFDLIGQPPPTPPLPPLPQFLDQVMPGHPALRVQQGKVEIQRQQLRADIGNFWPSATLTTQFTGAQNLEYFNGNNRAPRPTAFESYLSLTIPVYDFGQRRAAIDESTENVLAQKDLVGDIDRQTRNSIATAYNEIATYAETAATSLSDYVKSDRAAMLARAQADEGVGDELTWVQDQLSALQSKATLQTAQLNERLQYASLQNLAGGTWHWAP